MGFSGSTGRRLSVCPTTIGPAPHVGGYVLPLSAIGCRNSLKQRPRRIDFFILGCDGTYRHADQFMVLIG